MHTVPKHDTVILAGQEVTPELRSILLRFFNEADIIKLQRLGGRVQIAITAPFTDRKKTNHEQIVVDQSLIAQITALKEAPDQLGALLTKLTTKQLRDVASRLGKPVRSNTTAAEIRAQLVSFIQAEDYWMRITGRTDEIAKKKSQRE